MNDHAGSHELESSTDDSTDILTSGLKAPSNVHTQKPAVAFKVSYILLSLFFLWLFSVHIIGLLLFTKGFLLARHVLDDKSSCDLLPDGTAADNSHDGCWHPKTFEKAVVVLIDALRYDFTVPFLPTDQEPFPHSYHNGLPFMYSVATKNPEKSILLPFIADPPTTTLQRLKALTAGNLPTFIDMGSNFAGSATEEDNILVQLRALNKTIVHLGDDTWHDLFPGYFHPELTHKYPSFAVWDLHTVDNGVIEHIFPLLDPTRSPEWDVIFAHFLGVDHAGHEYGPDTPQMAEKLTQMDGVISQVADAIDDKTLLIVMGDHGMDSKGDHGGESDNEVEAALWMYSKLPHFGRMTQSDTKVPATAKERPVQQIDLVSTLSILLGLPVPFNNLGRPILEALVTHTPPTLDDMRNLGHANSLVFSQMERYKSRYQESQDFAESQTVVDVGTKMRSLLQTKAKSVAWDQVTQVFRTWHEGTINTYRQIWAKFELTDMAIGIAILLLGLVVLGLSVNVVAPDGTNELPPLLRNVVIGAVTGIVLALPRVLQDFSLTRLNESRGPLSLAAFGSLVGAIIARFPSSLQQSTRPTVWFVLAIFFTISQSAGFASNSYTIHEDTILTFLLTTFGLFSLWSSLRQKHNSDRVLGTYHSILFVLLTRTASYSRLCREEQMPGCRLTFYASEGSTSSGPWQLTIPFMVALCLPEIIKSFYKGTASYAGSAGFWIGFCFRMGLLLSAMYWISTAAESGAWLPERISSSTWRTIGITLARCALAIALPIGVATFIFSKPCLDVDIIATGTSESPKQRPQITILGFANAFGTRYFLLVPAIALATILLLPPMGQFAMAICTWQILCLLEVLDTNDLMISETSRSIIGPVVLAMLGSFHFFKTGHQAVLSSIQWKSAYVPLRELTYPWAPLLVILNTFGAQILCAAAVPLVVLWKRPISKAGLHSIWSDITYALSWHIFYYAVVQAATTMWAGHLRRHLMLYRVFMPKFLTASGVLIIVDVILIFISLGASRVTGASIAELFGY